MSHGKHLQQCYTIGTHLLNKDGLLRLFSPSNNGFDDIGTASARTETGCVDPKKDKSVPEARG